jgi:hypothetical protein
MSLPYRVSEFLQAIVNEKLTQFFLYISFLIFIMLTPFTTVCRWKKKA